MVIQCVILLNGYTMCVFLLNGYTMFDSTEWLNDV